MTEDYPPPTKSDKRNFDPNPSVTVTEDNPSPRSDKSNFDPNPSVTIAKDNPPPKSGKSSSDPNLSVTVAKDNPPPKSGKSSSDPNPSVIVAKDNPPPKSGKSSSDPDPPEESSSSLKFLGMTIKRPRLGPEFISDERFIKDLKQLLELRSFLIRDAVKLDIPASESLSFEGLNLLRYNIFGRFPTEEEWSQLERRTQTLFRLPTEAIRRKFILGGTPWWMSWVPVVLVGLALASLTLSVLFGYEPLPAIAGAQQRVKMLPSTILPFYAIWLMSLGAIGAVAFIGMNALSVQEDITFDLTNSRLMTLRIVLGALFGLILTLPFGFGDYVDFCRNIVSGSLVTDDRATTQAILLLLPFVLGFSTPLVILILNRFVEAIQSFFGKAGNPTAPPPGGPGSVVK